MSKELLPIRNISAKEYNEKYYWDCNGAYCFVANLEHAMQKSGAYEEAMHQLRCIGWPECKETLLKAVEVYREVVKSKIPGHNHYDFCHVVHCKDCVSYYNRCYCMKRSVKMTPDDFCSYGERRTECE